MTDYKLFISSAGIGSRLKAHTSFRNKGLLTLGLKPAIAHIIDKFDPRVPIVIAVGYKKNSLIEILEELFPARSIEYVQVDNFDGPGSGLGYSMLSCEEKLQCPFIFVPNDTLIKNTEIDLDPNRYGNWVGLFQNREHKVDPAHYRCAETVDNNVIGILPKGLNTENIYIGLCGIYDFEDFWSVMRSSKDSVEEGESFGLNGLVNKTAFYFIDWYDTGNLNSIETAFANYETEAHNILQKKEEAIWINNKKCIKYHKDPQFIRDRLERIKFLPEQLTPEMLNYGANFFSYKYVEGELLSKNSDIEFFGNFLDKISDKLWKNKADKFEKSIEFQKVFYRDKTLERVKLYLDRFDQKDKIKKINGKKVYLVCDVLEKFDWDKFYEGAIWSNFHGDLHGENILVQDKNGFTLLDWRQNFGEQNYEYGDVYYDLAKLMHGLVVRHEIVAKNKFSTKHITEDTVMIDIDNSMSFFNTGKFLENWITEHGYDLHRTKQVMALIFLNIAALHHYPYSKFLFLLGQLQMSELLEND